MILEILSPEKLVYKGTVRSARVPGCDGTFEILNNHAPIISTLSNGKIRVIDIDGKQSEYDITSGIVEQKDNHIIVLIT
jgi:F-type H+-transporting ATPase subunit epsilon